MLVPVRGRHWVVVLGAMDFRPPGGNARVSARGFETQAIVLRGGVDGLHVRLEPAS